MARKNKEDRRGRQRKDSGRQGRQKEDRGERQEGQDVTKVILVDLKILLLHHWECE